MDVVKGRVAPFLIRGAATPGRGSEDQREKADHDEQTNEKNDTDRATDELQHFRTSQLAK